MKSDDETLLELARVLDQVISSNSPAVKQHFEQLMILLALTRTSGELPAGPFEQLVNNVHSLFRQVEQMDHRLNQVELERNTFHNPFTITTSPNTSSPGYGAVPGTGMGTWTIGNATAATVGYAPNTVQGAFTISDTISLADMSGANGTVQIDFPDINLTLGSGAADDTITISNSTDFTNIDDLLKMYDIKLKKEKN